MKKLFKDSVLWATLLVLVALSGCASAPKERQDLHTRAMQQTIEANDIELSRACSAEELSAISSAKFKAVSHGDGADAWQKYYQAPGCILKEQQKREASRRQAFEARERRYKKDPESRPVIWFPPEYSQRRPLATE